MQYGMPLNELICSIVQSGSTYDYCHVILFSAAPLTFFYIKFMFLLCIGPPFYVCFR
uniref:Uncharacterized protein n=1 Tax=Arundo donax TaxID=35708 RepID=A0A0A9G1U8_ARUDO